MKNDVSQLILPIIFVVVTGFWFIAMTFGPIILFLINKSPDVGGVMAIAVGFVIFLPAFIASIIFLIITIKKGKKLN